MKVLHIINELGMGGAEVLLEQRLLNFNDSKCHIDLLVLLERENCFYTKRARVNNKDKQIITLSKKSFYSPLLIFKLIPHIKKYDIIHVHLFPSIYWVAIAKWISFSKIKLVFTEHSTSNRRMRTFLFKYIDTFIYNKYSKIIAISKEVDNSIKKHIRLKHHKIVLINNGIKIKAIQNAEKLTKEQLTGIINEDRKIILQVSSFQYPKDQKTLIRALNHLDENLILVLVGKGVEFENIKKYSENLQLNNRVFFLGIRMDVPQLLKTADIVVLSSHHEGMSLSSIEGLASGKPFIASNVPGLTEVVEGAGLLFEDNNDVELANHIKKLLADEHYYKQIATQCQERAKAYDIENMIQSEVDLYEEILNTKK